MSIGEEKTVGYKMLCEIKQAFQVLMTSDSICDDKEEMEFLIEAFARYVSTRYFVEEIS
jgi:hypothetical protein